jgi:hypothetical protein
MTSTGKNCLCVINSSRVIHQSEQVYVTEKILKKWLAATVVTQSAQTADVKFADF